MSPIENRPFDTLQVGEEERLVHVLTKEDFSLLATQAATFGAGVVDPTVVASPAYSADAAQSGWASALMCALIAGRLPGAGSKLIRQTIEASAAVAPGDVMTIVAKVMAKAPEGRRVTIEVRATNQRGEQAMAASAEIVAPKKTIAAEPPEEYFELIREKGRRYKILIERTRDLKALKTAVVHPVDEASLMGAIEAAREDLMEPVLVGPEAKIRRAADAAGIDIDGYPIVSTEHSHAAAEKAVAMARAGEVEALMKGALHTDELMQAVVATDTGLRTARRISHVFAIDAPAYPRALFITDAAVNIYPTLLDKRDIVQNAIELVLALGIATAPGRDPFCGRDGVARHPLDGRCGGAVQDGRSRPDRRRHPRRTARLSTMRFRWRRREPRELFRPSPARRTFSSFLTSRPATCWPSSSSISPKPRWPASCSGRACRSCSRAAPTTRIARLGSCAIALILARHRETRGAMTAARPWRSSQNRRMRRRTFRLSRRSAAARAATRGRQRQ